MDRAITAFDLAFSADNKRNLGATLEPESKSGNPENLSENWKDNFIAVAQNAPGKKNEK